MKKILNLIFIIPLTLLLVACKKDNISPKILKNEYNINQQATIDNINITLKEVYKEQDIIEFIFEIEKILYFMNYVICMNNQKLKRFG